MKQILNSAVWGKAYIDEKNATLAFRIKFNAKKGERAIFTLSAKQLYKIIFNGKFIHYGPERTAHGYSKVDVLQIMPESGENILCIEVYQAGVMNYYLPLEKAYFSANLTIAERVYNTTDFECFHLSDRVQNCQRYCGQRTFIEDYVASCCRTDFYSGKNTYQKVETVFVKADKFINKDCEYPTLKEFDEVKLIEYGRVLEGKKKRKYSIPNLTRARKNGEKIDYEVLTDKVNDFTFYRGDRVKIGGKYYLYEFEREISGFINLDLTVDQDAEIILVFDEVLLPQKNENSALCLSFARMSCANVLRWKLSKGIYHLSTFEAYAFKYVKVIVRTGIVDAVKISATRYENGAKEVFACKIEDKELENIVVSAYNTFRQNSVDMLFDCPSRERAGWINDVWFSRECTYLFAGDEKPFKSLLRAYALASYLGLPKGMIPMCYPADFRTGLFMVACALWYVCCLAEYEKIHGKDQIVELGIKKIKGLFEYLTDFENEYELLENLKGKIFVEWSKANTKAYVKGVNFPSNMLYAKALAMAGKLLEDEGLIKKADRIRKQIVRFSYNGEFFEDNAVRKRGKLELCGHVTEVCQYYAFECDIANKKSFPKLYKTLVESFVPKETAPEKYSFITRSNIIIGLLIREKLAVQNCEMERAKKELKLIYSCMANKTATLWEHEREKASCNHGIAAFAGVCVIKAITGYDHLKDGVLYFKKIEYKTNCDIIFPCGTDSVRIIIENGEINIQTKLQYKFI